MSYEIDTKNAYRNEAKANAYKNQYTEGIKWARFTMWQQKKIITKFLEACNLESKDKVLDIPCGAGYIGSVLAKYEASVVASDISEEMMDLAKFEYDDVKFDGFVQADITKTPFPSDDFKCVIVLSLMHRLPQVVRKEVLLEVARLTNKYLIISYSIDSRVQRVKQWILLKIKPTHIPAPVSIPFKVMFDEMTSAGLKIIKSKRIVYLLSSKVVCLATNTSGSTK